MKGFSLLGLRKRSVLVLWLAFVVLCCSASSCQPSATNSQPTICYLMNRCDLAEFSLRNSLDMDIVGVGRITGGDATASTPVGTPFVDLVAKIDPNNLSIKKVTVLWGDALPEQTVGDIPMVDEADATRETGVAPTNPAMWAVRMPLRGVTPPTETTYTREITGNARVDGFLRSLPLSPFKQTTVIRTPGARMNPGARFMFQYKVEFQSGSSPTQTMYGPIQTMIYGPESASVFFQRGLEGHALQGDLQTGDAGVDLTVRLSQSVSVPVSVNFYSERDDMLEITSGGQPVRSISFPAGTTVIPVHVRVKAQVGMPFAVFAKASGWNSPVLSVAK